MGHDELTSHAMAGDRDLRYTDILSQWAATGVIAPRWSVCWSSSEGCFRCRFTLLRGWGMPPAHCNFTEAEMILYVQGAADWARTLVGPAAAQLADEKRGTRNGMTDYMPPVGGEKRHYPEISDDECVDSDGQVWPEHDYPPKGHGDECYRCGAEAED